MRIEEWVKERRDDLMYFHKYVIANPKEFPLSEDIDWDTLFKEWLIFHYSEDQNAKD